MADDHHFRVCLDRTSIELHSMFGFSLGLKALDVRFAEQEVVKSDIKFAFRNSKAFAISRYSDGSWPVLYTAKDARTAIFEVSYHILGSWKTHTSVKTGKKYRRSARLVYAISPPKKPLFLVSEEAEYLHSTNYGPCHIIARSARAKNLCGLDAPSVRKKGGRCVPIFDKYSVIFTPGLEKKFSIKWDCINDTIHHNADGQQEIIDLWHA